MKFCFNWYGNSNDECLNIADEVNINLDKVIDLNDIKEYCKQHNNQRINLCINLEDYKMTTDKIILAFELQQELKDYNIIVRLPTYNKQIKEIIEKYKEAKFFFETRIDTWDLIYGYTNLGVTDLYIISGLGFELEEIKKFLENYENKPQIRVFPNVAQSNFQDTDDLKTFWIRPEDIKYYEDYIDVYEFYGEPNKQKIYYDIYFKDKEWNGPLNEIIISFNNNIKSSTIVPRFGMNRINCRQRCLKGKMCNMCKTIETLANHFNETNLKITNIKGEEEENGKRTN